MKRPCVVCGEKEARANSDTCCNKHALRLRVWRCRKRAGTLLVTSTEHECACGCGRRFFRNNMAADANVVSQVSPGQQRLFFSDKCKDQVRKERACLDDEDEATPPLR